MTASIRPEPEDAADRDRVVEATCRHQLLGGQWTQQAEAHLQRFFDKSTWGSLPPPVTSFNLFQSLILQTSTLLDDGATVKFAGRTPSKADQDLLDLPMLWAQQQETLEFVRGMNDSFLRLGWDARRNRVLYHPVAHGWIDHAEPDPEQPSQPAFVRHLRTRPVREGDVTVERWVYDEYDRRDPNHWTFRSLVADGPLKGADVTADVLALGAKTDEGRAAADRARDTGWLYWLGDQPIWNWVAYHQRLRHQLWDPFRGHELVDGTLTVSTLLTFWLGGVRDAAYSLRWIMDAEVAGRPKNGDPWIPINPTAMLQLKSREQARSGQAGQFSASMDTAATMESILGLSASMAQYAGLSSADVSVGSVGLSRTSGYAIEVSRAGKRGIEKKMVAPMMISDQLTLATAAQFATAYGGARGLPLEPEAYHVVYSATPRTVEETRAEVDRLKSLVESSLLHPADALIELNSRLTRDEAIEQAKEIARFRAELVAIAAGEPAEASVEDEAEPTEEAEAPDEVEVDDQAEAVAPPPRILGTVGNGFEPAVPAGEEA